MCRSFWCPCWRWAASLHLCLLGLVSNVAWKEGVHLHSNLEPVLPAQREPENMRRWRSLPPKALPAAYLATMHEMFRVLDHVTGGCAAKQTSDQGAGLAAGSGPDEGLDGDNESLDGEEAGDRPRKSRRKDAAGRKSQRGSRSTMRRLIELKTLSPLHPVF